MFSRNVVHKYISVVKVQQTTQFEKLLTLFNMSNNLVKANFMPTLLSNYVQSVIASRFHVEQLINIQIKSTIKACFYMTKHMLCSKI